ncbi:fungal-specific transcription factor domain-containing protein [Pseudomassariella vexata]|uniref:Fungal-specific transcription factor domain-domain-containing protein n=1 Tax=Pseudomassariella vexata TaxID=1141098 RepID=A0A1Y2E7Q2_9PEZI|nr:fungal-specific transcription factor domain-containing protein [Pseudomassariella vexata]ORY67569.1 fungal-specific transcription factor domain-domain-containing protein [Pseudomassariella vexata]
MESPRQHSESPTLISTSTRKRKRSTDRVRVTRACDRCKRRKIKCSGVQPCELCILAGLKCTFEATYSRGRLPSIPAVANVEARSASSRQDVPASERADLFPKMITPSNSPPVHEHQSSTPSPSRSRRQIDYHSEIHSNSLQPPGLAYAPASLRTSPEPSQTDLEGHYVGPASGVSFLLRIQKRLHQAVSFSHASSIFTFGDAPMPSFDPSFCMLLPREEAQRLVDRYFDFAMPTYRFLHRPTVQKWLGEFYDTMGIMDDRDSAPAKIALLFMVFAQGKEYMPPYEGSTYADFSQRYFLVAENQLSKERGAVRLTSVQARLAQCFFLLSQSRINHCWSLFGTMSHLALAIGLNRGRKSEPTSASSQIENECRRRTFWCAYTLDNYLSAALGRPRTFHDEDIDQDLPSCADDDELSGEGHSFRPVNSINRGQPIMFAAVAHFRLVRIVSIILRNLYSIHPLSMSTRASLAAKYSVSLVDWRMELSSFLDADGLNTAPLMPIFQRQRNILNLAYWHAQILIHRPFLLSNFMRMQGQSHHSSDHISSSQTEESVKQCLTAAMKIVETIDELTKTHLMFRAFWVTTYFAFTAVIILYVYTIQQRNSPPETYSRYLSAASRCQAQIANVAKNESLTQRYCVVLEELRLEALRQTKRVQLPAMTGPQDVASRTIMPGSSHLPSVKMQNTSNDATMSDFSGMGLGDFTDWGHFASMVSSGLGNLDDLLNDNSLGL